MKTSRSILLLISPFIPLMLITGCHKSSANHKTEGMIWNTLYHITYKGPEELQDSILPVLNEVGASLSVFDKNSIVSKLNSSDSIKADIHLITVYDETLRINRLSHDSFDPTVSPLIDAWGFGLGHSPNADTLAIDSIMKFIGLDKTRRAGDFIIKEDSRTRFNFSAIAKGYGCDAVGEMFLRNNVTDYMVEIGGEISLRGKSPSGKDWKIAIDAPVEGALPGEETALILNITDAGIATSGNYRNFRDEEGVRTAHTISPVTGRPVKGKLLSATVVAGCCMTADGLATACMASEDPVGLIRESGADAVLIFPDSIWISTGLKSHISEPL